MKNKSEQERLIQTVARINAFALAFVFAVLCGFGLFLMTVLLLLRGGDPVGPHLQLLGQFFIGYSVTWPGSFIGLFYGMLAGAVLGGALGYIYNRAVYLLGAKTVTIQPRMRGEQSEGM